MAQASSLDQFLRNNKCDDRSSITNTRIPDKNLGIYGGKYCIPEEKIDEFHKLYHKKVFINGELEYLTEKQLDSGMITLDFDFRYDKEIEERQHTDDHIDDLIEMYLEQIKNILIVKPNKRFHIWVFHKDNVNQLEDKTKDGIHILIELGMSKGAQIILRKKILGECSNVLEDLPLKNRYDDVLDSGVTSGTVNWQVFGSRKPGNESYKITNTYKVYYDENEEENIEEIENHSSLDLIKFTSVRRKDLLKFECKEQIKKELQNMTKKKKKSKKKIKLKLNKNALINTAESFMNVSNTEELDAIIKTQLENTKYEDDKVFREMHEFTMLLDQKYYEPYDAWIKVGWALKNTDHRLWWTWIKFSSKGTSFSFNELDTFYKIWFDNTNSTSETKELTKYSIMYWAKDCDPVKYEQIKKNCVEYLLRDAISGETEYDMAIVLEKLYGDVYKCVSIRSKIWYQYINGIWISTECGNTLRRKLSKNIHDMCKTLQNTAYNNLLAIIDEQDDDEEDEEQLKESRKFCKKIAKIALKLKSTAWKTNIMKEASDIFYDKDFINKIDKNPDLICFENGIVDLEKKEFREGRPSDYVSKCTKIPYIEFDETNNEHIKIKKEIEEFMEQLFPHDELREYMWQHLAASLSGRIKNQTFNIYNGGGRNGKSVLAELMEAVLGNYCGHVPITLVTGGRPTIGSLSPEVAALKGVRYAIMQEPSKGMELNEGVMKQLTGGDDLQARALYQDSITFKPQFSLIVCTNNLFKINSTDHGTWRRIRKVDFVSTFVENPSTDARDFEFKVDKNTSKKVPRWAPIMASLLVKKYFETDGNVVDCPMVVQASKEYQQETDYFGLFISEKISKMEGHSFHRSAVKKEFDDWFIDLYSSKPPSGTELYNYLDSKLGKRKSDKKWHGFALSSYLEQYDSNFIPNQII